MTMTMENGKTGVAQPQTRKKPEALAIGFFPVSARRPAGEGWAACYARKATVPVSASIESMIASESRS
ncbi:hypothetical protein D2E22_0440 [Bifidobacterium castoris]|uniref:Uncharacterized protein n=1 Tax=Bifidobacterium castoris TaxID=2306972 RepID=A0A430FAV6_9BIFI|nr:hypothetical protein D2E22_0440 [Bifidobacterium castoris]